MSETKLMIENKRLRSLIKYVQATLTNVDYRNGMVDSRIIQDMSSHIEYRVDHLMDDDFNHLIGKKFN